MVTGAKDSGKTAFLDDLTDQIRQIQTTGRTTPAPQESKNTQAGTKSTPSKSELLQSSPLPDKISASNKALINLSNLPVCAPKGIDPSKILNDFKGIKIAHRADLVNVEQDYVMFKETNDKSPSAYVNPTTEELGRILEAKVNLEYSANPGGLEENIVRKLQICRGEEPIEEQYRGHRYKELPVYVYSSNKVTEEQQVAEAPNGWRGFSLNTIVPNNKVDYLLVQLAAAGLHSNEYKIGVDRIDSERKILYLNPSNWERVTQFFEELKKNPNFPSDASEKLYEQVVNLFKLESAQLNNQKTLGWSAHSGTVFSFLSLIGMAFMYRLQEKTMDKMGQQGEVDPSKFLVDETEFAKQPGYSDLVGEEDVIKEMQRAFLKDEMSNVVITGPAGEGKSATVRELYARITSGKIKHFKGAKVYVLDMTAMQGEGGVFSGKFEKAFSELMRKVKSSKEVCFINVKEAHLIKGAGSSSGKPNGLEELIKIELEAPNSKIKWIFDTDRPQILTGDDAFARRVTVVTKKPATFQKTLDVFKSEKGPLAQIQKKYGIQVRGEAAEAIVAFSQQLYKGGKIAASKNLLNDLVAEARMDEKKEITLEDVIKEVSNKTGSSIEDVQTNLKERLAHEAQTFGKIDSKSSSNEPPTSSPKDSGTPPKEPPSQQPPSQGPSSGKGGQGKSKPHQQTEIAARTQEGVAEISLPSSRSGTLLDGVKGTAAGAGPLLVMDVAEHYGVLTPEGRKVADTAFISTLAVANPVNLSHLALMVAPFEAGRVATAEIAKATGIEAVREGTLINKLLQTSGGLVAAAGTTKAIGAEVLHQVSVGLMDKVGSFLYSTEQAVVSVAQSARSAANQSIMSAQMIASSAMQTVRSVGNSALSQAGQLLQSARSMMSQITVGTTAAYAATRTALLAARPALNRIGVLAAETIAKRLSQGALASLADGPLPIGEAVAAGLLIYGVFEIGYGTYKVIQEA